MVNLQGEQSVYSNQKVAFINKLSKEFELYFEVKPTYIYGTQVANVLRFMINEQDNSDKMLAFWFNDNVNGTMKFISRLNNSATFQFVSKTRIPLQQWTMIYAYQALVNGDYVFAVSVNGTVECTETIKNASDFYNVKVYASDPFSVSQQGSIRKLLVSTQAPGKITFKNSRYVHPLIAK